MKEKTPTQEANIAIHLPRMAAQQPDVPAIVFPGRKHGIWDYATLNSTADGYALALQQAGVKPGDKALIMLPSSPELIATAFALFKMGVLPVMLDPGMGMENMMRCVRHVQPSIFIGIAKAQMMRILYRKSFTSVKKSFTASDWFPSAPALSKLAQKYKGQTFEVHPVKPHDTAAILFTSGSTGPAKGVVYQHSMFQAQVRALSQLFDFEPGEIDVPGYPLFALFDVALGMTSVIPHIDPSKPAACNPALVVDTIKKYNASTCQGSPTIWGKVGNYCKECNITLPSLKRVITFGAPVSIQLLKTWKNILSPEADVYTPYGATECLPIALMRGSEVLQETAELTTEGAGTCVGRLAPCTEAKIIKISDEPIAKLDDDLFVPNGTVGEIIVHGDVVTQEYYEEPEANALSKIPGADGRFWHRVGDVGYFDDQERLWFCGRKNHRVETAQGTIFPVQAEGMANAHPAVLRSAVVGVGKPGQQEPILLVEAKEIPEDDKKEALLVRQILARYDDHEKFGNIRQLLFHPGFPVDPRHNAKIHREELAVWAAKELR